MRTWIIALAVMMVLPAVGAAATIVTTPVEEQLVEGHTVFTVIEVVRNTTTLREEFHAAVAVLVREVEQRQDAFRFPGVLWFNDQYLVNPVARNDQQVNFRYPCTGSVIAVDATAFGADPRPEAQAMDPRPVDLGGHYLESYHITDPNDNVWDVDKWQGTEGHIWTVAIKNNQIGYNTPDDGVCSSAPYTDRQCIVPGVTGSGGTTPDASGTQCKYPYYEPGRHTSTPSTTLEEDWEGKGYPCGQDGANANCANIRYNALLYFRMDDLAAADAGVIKDHRDVGADRQNDVSGCHPYYGEYTYSTSASNGPWPCPGGDDNAEGNSHAYNPELPWPAMSYDGRKNHGGSGFNDCDGDGQVTNPEGRNDYTGDYMCHATQNIRLYFHYNPAPIVREYYVMDVVGSAAPFHCHDSMEVCNLGEAVNNPTGYPNDYVSTADDVEDESRNP